MRLAGLTARSLRRIAHQMPSFGWRRAVRGLDADQLANEIQRTYGHPDAYENFVHGRSALLFREWNVIVYVDWEAFYYEDVLYDDVDAAWQDYNTLEEGVNALWTADVAAAL